MAQTNFKDREEIPAEYKWDLNAIYSNWEEWENGLKRNGSQNGNDYIF